jgi:DNA-binding NtrC family response regulator
LVELAGQTAEPRRIVTVLVVDDEESFHDSVARHLRKYRVLAAYNGWQALDALSAHHVDVVLLDLKMPGLTGFELLDKIRIDHDDVETIVITANAVIESAVTAIKGGAFDFVAKSYESYKQLDAYIGRALRHRWRKRERAESSHAEKWLEKSFELMKASPTEALRNTVAIIDEVAPSNVPVLFEGEVGVGKEMLARYLHSRSDRADALFVVADVSMVPASLLESHLFGHLKGAFDGAEKLHVGKFELADGGTLFIQEIGKLTDSVQGKLLQALQTRTVLRLGAREASPVDVRLVVATEMNLKREVRKGRFRKELFERLNVVQVKVPPLRERREDLPDLLALFAAKHSRKLGHGELAFNDGAMEILCEYDWPGNQDELENMVTRLVAVNPDSVITEDDIPIDYFLPTLHKEAEEAALHSTSGNRDKGLYFLAREQFERYLVRRMINRFGGDQRAAAAVLGVSHSTVKGKMREE